MPRKDGKQQIIDAAKSIIARHGVTNAGVQAIVDEAGISKGGLYYHYKSKEMLLYDIVDQALRAVIQPVKRSALQKTDPAELVEMSLDGIAQRLRDEDSNRLQFYLTHEAIVGNDELKERFAEKYASWVDTIELLLDRMYEHEHSPWNRALAATLIAAIDGQVIQLLLDAKVVTVEQLLDFWRALGEGGLPVLLAYLSERATKLPAE